MQKGVYKKIKQIREEKHFSQEYMALSLDISQSYYAKIEKGQKELTLSRLFKISKLLDINLSLLFQEITEA